MVVEDAAAANALKVMMLHKEGVVNENNLQWFFFEMLQQQLSHFPTLLSMTRQLCTH